MKKVVLTTICICLLFVIFSQAANTDRFYQGIVTKEETFTSVIYKWTITIGATATDQLHSPAMFIADCNNKYGYCLATSNAASSGYLLFHFGTGASWFTTITPSVLATISTTTKIDTVGYEDGVTYAFATGEWLIAELDYDGAGCTTGDVFTVEFVFIKDQPYCDSAGRLIPVGRILTQSGVGWTNP